MAQAPPDEDDAEGGEIAGDIADERSDFLSMMAHLYRGELGRTTAWRTRIDRTTNWAVVLTATLLTWAFSSETRPHYVVLVGVATVTVFLGIEARRYRVYDIWRSRVRLLEENVFANALEADGAEQLNWRELLSDDLREPAVKTPAVEAVSRRLRRVYLPLITVLVGAWVIRLTAFADGAGPVETASVGNVHGSYVVGGVSVFYAALVAVALRRGRRAKGELKQKGSEDWK
ncbi:MAG: putative membrane protein [Methanobacteriota archaeon]|jgi:uncharacterized membrane protein|uniref:DUF2270 domain-containing protein n=1 Tax=Halorutilus salinus TaxID=2487751 RepID=A0A9Q4C2N2_9EURY|nr:DUF2270 domain-containing protein [Halorutilus salinus]MCX2818188.1 DUF2270 domain-containing protein [Halorutilus salinus]